MESEQLAAPLRTVLAGAAAGEDSRFEPVRDGVSGVTSHVLKTPVARIVQSFYFVNDGFSASGRHLWFYASSGGTRSLGIIDFERRECRLVPDTDFLDASPLVDPATGDALWIAGTALWRRAPEPGARPRQLGRLADELARGERPYRISTHLTYRADRRALSLDAQFDGRWFAGEWLLADGSVRVWKHFDRCYNHAQFSPVAPDVQMIAQDGWTDPTTGRNHDYERRIWILSRHGDCEPLYAEPTPMHGHEWWDADGEHVWFVHYGAGVKRTSIGTRREETVWPGAYSHAHASTDGRYVVVDSDASGREPRCRVHFLNRRTGRSVRIADHPWVGDPDAWRYHVHPHPRFVLADRWLHYTTFHGGRIGLALTSVEELVAATS